MSHVSSYNIAVGLCSPLLCSALSDSPMGAGAVTTLHSRPLFAGVSPRRIPFPPTNGAFHFPLSFPSCPKLRSFSRTIRAVESSGQANSDGSNHGKIFNSVNSLSLTKALSNFVASNFLPIALISGVALGITNPTLGCIAHRYSLSTVSTFGIFIISGLKLQGGEIRAVAEAWPALVFGLVSILLLSPFFSKIILQIQLAPQEFVTGLAIFSCMPTTLSSGVALTQLVCGNSALALAMTVMSNLLGILIVPFWISRFLANDFGASIPTEKLLWSLIFTLLVPLVLGKVLRSCFQGLATYVDQNPRIFSVASTILLSLQQLHGWHYEAKAVHDAFVVMAQRWQCGLSGMMEGEAKTRVVTLKKTRVRNNEVEAMSRV